MHFWYNYFSLFPCIIMKLIGQKDIISLVDMARDAEEDEEITKKKKLIYGFIARRNSNKKWEIEFSCRRHPECKLQARRGGIREFSRLSGVQKFMELIGITEFTVIL